ncbi:MAG: hypothetical protein D6731_20550 [Planctomycetota bacterium]|nr:MAG: hypothetical protein D6731_20550 [Planctomycetota bacterium]
MDEGLRRHERAAAAGDERAAVRLARQHLRAGRRDRALAATEGARSPPLLALRAELLCEADPSVAADCALAALRRDPAALPATLRTRLGAALRRAHAAAETAVAALAAAQRLVGLGFAAAPPPGTEYLLEAGRASAGLPPSPDEGALARALRRGRTGLLPHPEESPPSRLFSAHGPDFFSGTFLVFAASCEDRLTYFEAALFDAVDALLPAPDPGWPRRLAFGRGYGLAVERGAPTGLLRRAVEEVNAERLLPFPLEVHDHQPFDVLEGISGAGGLAPRDERLAWRFAEDLARHPARLGGDAEAPPYARLLAAFRGGNPPSGRLEALLGECGEAYGPVGLAALTRFARRAARENERMQARRARRER